MNEVNSPFEEPARYWDYREGQPVLVEGRRPAGYYYTLTLVSPKFTYVKRSR